MVSMKNVCILALTLALVTAKPLERERRETSRQPLEISTEKRKEEKALNFDDTMYDLLPDGDNYDYYDYFDSWLHDQMYAAHEILGRSRHLLNHASECQKLLLEISDPEDLEKAQKAIDALSQAIRVAQSTSQIILDGFEPTKSSLGALSDVCDVADGFNEWTHFAFPILIPKSASIDFTNTKAYNSCYQVWTRCFFIEIVSDRLCEAAGDQRILDLVKDTDMAN